MRHFSSLRPVAVVLLGGALLSSCGSGTSDTKTSTPSSTLGTDSAATKVGGLPDTTGTGQPAAGATMGGAGRPAAGSTGPSGTTNGTGAN